MNSGEFVSKAAQPMQEVYGIEIAELDMLEFEDYTNLASIEPSDIFDDDDYMVELIEYNNLKLT